MDAPGQKSKNIVIFILIGLAMIGASFFWPQGGPRNPVDIVRFAWNSSLDKLLDWAAIWNSIRVLLWTIAGFLIIDALATWAMVVKRTQLALIIYFLLPIPCLGFLFGVFCLLRAIF